jgi:hypothetical protein
MRHYLYILSAIWLCATAALADPSSSDKSSASEAYMQLHAKELSATCYEDLLPLRSRASIATDTPMSDEEKKAFFPLFKAMQIQKVKVTGEKVDGDKATLTVISQPDPDAKTQEVAEGEIKLNFEDGQWKLEHEKWSSKITVKE